MLRSDPANQLLEELKMKMTKTKQQLTLGAATLLAVLACSVQAQPVARDGLLADATGRTVYTFDKDTAGKSTCTGGCLSAWPMFVAKAGAKPQGDFGLIEATGGQQQWTIKGKPLYYFAGDAQPGERNGDGSGGVWHVVPAAGAKY